MATIAPTAATPPPPVTTGPLPPPLPEPIPASGSGTGSGSLRIRIANWMEDRFGKAAMPVAALAGGALGGTVGMLTLGPVGAAVGGLGGAFAGAVLFMAG
jgi:hypothetical protein